MNLTPWYPPHIKPVRVGVYNASYCKEPGVFRYWNGEYWSSAWSGNNSQQDIEFFKDCVAMDQDDIHWRGLSAALPAPSVELSDDTARKLLDKYIAEGHSSDHASGFVDGVRALHRAIKEAKGSV